MKRLVLITMLLPVVIGACKKDKDRPAPNPDYAYIIDSDYALAEFDFNDDGVTTPISGIMSGTAKVDRTAMNTVTISESVKVSTSPAVNITMSGLAVTLVGTRYEARILNVLHADVSGNTLTVYIDGKARAKYVK